ncbi:hypothetical protein ANCDUO_17845 [Ancylostoma duodenale]|uniref:Uncharacterized protein n=1 Tax=Ancylostoma duodenale TaxID=51022 RepID=A0A0C2G4T1_9BILA|nr:hypothetical protein ANCDUO_17845 [Ancylostoma duodenale]
MSSPGKPTFVTACPPALSSGKGAMSGGSMQKTFHEAMRQRRTSLPANSLTLGKLQEAIAVRMGRLMQPHLHVDRGIFRRTLCPEHIHYVALCLLNRLLND